MSSKNESAGVVIFALCINLTIAAFKTICAVITNSSSMISEAIHSFVDCGNQILMLIGYSEARRPATEQNPLGFHRTIYIYSFLVPALIFIGGASTSLYEGVTKILNPEPLDPIHALGFTIPATVFNLIILGVSLVLESVGLRKAWSSFRKNHPDSLLAEMKKTRDTSILISVLEDGGAVIGLIFSIFFTVMTMITGNTVFDGLGAIFVGLLLLSVSAFLAKETKSLANGENNPVIANFAKKQAESIEGLTQVNSAYAIQLGPEAVLVLLSLDWDDNLTAGTIEKHTQTIDTAIRKTHPAVVKTYVEPRSDKNK